MKRRGFTLIELMFVVAIIGLLASVALPKFAALLRRSQEGSTKGNLAVIRSALSLYFADNNSYPTGAWNTNSPVLLDTLVPKYIGAIPRVRLGTYHGDTALVFAQNSVNVDAAVDGEAGWVYDSQPAGFPVDNDLGTIWVSCTHTDTKGSSWTNF